MEKALEENNWKVLSVDENNISHGKWAYIWEWVYCGKGIFYNKEKNYIRYKDTIIPFTKSKASLFIKYLFDNPEVWCFPKSMEKFIRRSIRKNGSLFPDTANTYVYIIFASIGEKSAYKFLWKYIKKTKIGKKVVYRFKI